MFKGCVGPKHKSCSPTRKPAPVANHVPPSSTSDWNQTIASHSSDLTSRSPFLFSSCRSPTPTATVISTASTGGHRCSTQTPPAQTIGAYTSVVAAGDRNPGHLQSMVSIFSKSPPSIYSDDVAAANSPLLPELLHRTVIFSFFDEKPLRHCFFFRRKTHCRTTIASLVDHHSSPMT